MVCPRPRRTRGSGRCTATRTSSRQAATWQRSPPPAGSPSRSRPTRTWPPGARSSTPTRPSTPSSARSCRGASRSGRSRSTSTSSAGLTEEVLDAGLAAGEFDFVDAVAKEVPIRVLARIMGLPGADLDTFIDLGDRLIANTDPEITDVVWGRDDTDAYRRFPFRSPYGKQLWDLGRDIVRDRLRSPGDDLLSTLLRAEVDGDRLSETDLDNFFSIMVVAGNETTRIAIAQGVLAFCEHPEQWERLRADRGPAGPRDRGGPAVELPDPLHAADGRRRHRAGRRARSGPATRWCSGTCPGTGTRPSSMTRRPSTSPGPPTGTCPSAAAGPHLCLGAHLARLEVRIVLAALARRVAAFELAGAAAPDPLELHQRAQGTAGPRPAGLSRSGHDRAPAAAHPDREPDHAAAAGRRRPGHLRRRGRAGRDRRGDGQRAHRARALGERGRPARQPAGLRDAGQPGPGDAVAEPGRPAQRDRRRHAAPPAGRRGHHQPAAAPAGHRQGPGHPGPAQPRQAGRAAHGELAPGRVRRARRSLRPPRRHP